MSYVESLSITKEIMLVDSTWAVVPTWTSLLYASPQAKLIDDEFIAGHLYRYRFWRENAPVESGPSEVIEFLSPLLVKVES